MRIAITASGPTLDADLDPRFGRCAYFLIVDTDTLDFEAVENPNVALGGGAGIQSAQLIAAKDVKFVLTGNCGPNAHATLSAASIEVIPGCSGAVRDAVERFKAGQFNAASEPNVARHSGMADTPSPPASPGSAVVRVWGAGPVAAVAAEAWGEVWAKEWDEAEDKVADEAAVWVLRATALGLPAGRLQEPPQMVGGHPAVAC